jgi:hypothetical protein
MSQPAKVFVFIAQALEVGSLSDQVSRRVVMAAKALLAESNTDPTPLLGQFSTESQQTIMSHFQK